MEHNLDFFSNCSVHYNVVVELKISSLENFFLICISIFLFNGLHVGFLQL